MKKTRRAAKVGQYQWFRAWEQGLHTPEKGDKNHVPFKKLREQMRKVHGR